MDPINYGIWNAAFFGSSYLKKQHRIQSIGLVCTLSMDVPSTVEIPIRFLGAVNLVSTAAKILDEFQFYVNDTIIVSHGCWLAPSRVASTLREKGFKWIYTPHGMLEEWSLKQGRLKKFFYWHLVEKRVSSESDLIRAVSRNEKVNLEKSFSQQVRVVENGVKIESAYNKPTDEIRFLFMARLHFKKGITSLVRAWISVMQNHSDKKLIIAGPDEGELKNIAPHLSANLKYLGPVYGEAKVNLLASAHFYLLPSYSEGFPTSVLEAMSYGAIPLISRGCNFPEVFENNLGYQIEPDDDSIAFQLSRLKDKGFDQELSDKNRAFIEKYYSEPAIGEKLFSLYRSLL